ncbi:uncharacterized protein LOC116417755 [Nasonia vitripennis]|uniref:Uncharacterized protein n=1 Tax=Nasonia vitripennis TaxID=7425 RepID=A0A7M7QJ74_NASVI|nr:uncharacterized protein LOC116417755 [Nasonia vitripennis]
MSLRSGESLRTLELPPLKHHHLLASLQMTSTNTLVPSPMIHWLLQLRIGRFGCCVVLPHPGQRQRWHPTGCNFKGTVRTRSFTMSDFQPVLERVTLPLCLEDVAGTSTEQGQFTNSPD